MPRPTRSPASCRRPSRARRRREAARSWWQDAPMTEPKSEPKRVVVWGTGFVGKMVIPEVLRHPHFELVGVGVHDTDKVGRDVGEICGIAPVGLAATDDLDALIAERPDALVHYGPTAGHAEANIRDIG